MIPRTPVQSSNIKSIGYDASSQTLAVEFSNSGIYNYAGVPADAHAALMGAKSVGGYFSSNIRGKFDAKKAGADEQQPR